jgi:protein O-GlcNAc transferase
MSLLTKFVGSLIRGRDEHDPAAADSTANAVDGPKLLQRADAAAKEGRLESALCFYDACLKSQPRSLDAQLGAAAVLVDLWKNDDAVAAYERALEMAPGAGPIFSALLFHHHYLSPVDPARMLALHRAYGAMLQNTWPQAATGYPQQPAPERRLRIGYVSPNLSRHSVGYFIEPVIRSHDRRRFEVFCYYNHALADDATRRMREAADGWRDIATRDDESVVRMVRDDAIDILIDLAGHSKGNRLDVFARRPAPVQITWLGYPDTTGLASMDYRLTDHVADPAPAAELRHTEKLLRMDGCFICYEPPADAPPVKPRQHNEPVIFSSFNSIAKVNAETISLWSEILAEIPGSRLALKSAPLRFPETVERVLEALERNGVDPARVDVRGWIGERRQHLEAYGDVDIALDTFPYNGTTTTCEALWMGVPVVTLAGDVHMARVGASILQCAGLDDLVAHDKAAYVRLAVALANDRERRQALRAGLRGQLAASPMLDHAGFTRGLEAHYRQAWRAWCGTKSAA